MENKGKSIPKLKWYYLYTIVYIIIAFIVFWLTILLQDSLSFLAIINALYMVAIGFFIAFWFMIMSNSNLFTMITYSFKSLKNTIIKNKVKVDYYTYVTDREKIPKRIWLSTLFASAPFLLISIVLNIIYVTDM